MSARMPRLRLPAVRLLPFTIAAMAGLLAVKSVDLVRAAVPEGRAEPAHAASAEPAVPAHHSQPSPKKPEPEVPTAAPVAEMPPVEPMAPSGPPVSESERALLLDLRQRRTELEAREAALATRESVLAAAEHRIGARVDELTALQSRLEALEAARRDRDDANWRGMVKLYEAMKPREAAVIFNDLDQAVLLPILDRMKETKAAMVLAAMQPDRARQATDELARLRLRANTIQPVPSTAPVAAPIAAPASPASAPVAKPVAVPAAANPPAMPGGTPNAVPAPGAARHG